MTEKFRQFILFLGDLLLLYTSLFLALSIRNQSIIGGETWSNHWPVFSIAFAIWVIIFYITGVYTLNNIRNDLRFYATASQAMGVNILLAIAFFYVLPQAQLAPKTILVLNGVLFFILFTGWRQISHRWISKTALKRNVLIVGDGNIARELTELLDHNPQFGYQVAAILNHNAADSPGNLADYRDPGQLSLVLARHRIGWRIIGRNDLLRAVQARWPAPRHVVSPLSLTVLCISRT